jgi:carboxypeptidase Taq
MDRAERAFSDLKTHLAEIEDLDRIESLLAWDQQTIMPPKGGAGRAEQLATLTKLIHERLTSEQTGRLLDEAAPFAEGQAYDSFEASLIRVTRRDYEKARRVPTELATEMARLSAQAYPEWVEAKHQADFSRFLPFLEQQLELRRRYIACFEPAESPYDVLLDDFDPGMTTAEVADVFATLREGLKPLVAWVRERADAVDDGLLHGQFPIDQQRQFALAVIERFGYSAEAWRLDPTEHPFASAIGIDDIRLTTRFDESWVNQGLFATMHECGHGLYEHGIDQALDRSPLAEGGSLAMHESQSRTWENIVGRSRPFWRHFFPSFRDTFPEAMEGVDEEAVYRAVNKMQPSLIRVEADELTYNLHIVLRFELEQALLAGDVKPAELPEVWNARMRDDLGIEPPDDGQGVLQDVHWAIGLIGYFPTYALGNLIAAQLHERAQADLPDLEAQWAAGEFGQLRHWHQSHIHRHGRILTTKDLLERIVGGGLSAEPLLRYLRNKVSDLYGEPPATAAA